jgi:rubrerythrin
MHVETPVHACRKCAVRAARTEICHATLTGSARGARPDARTTRSCSNEDACNNHCVMPITLAQATRNAIAAEQAAEKFYLGLAAGCDGAEGRQLLMDIAAQERSHAATLESLAAQLVTGQLPDHADALVHVIESAPASRHAQGLSLSDALEIAIEAEDSAILYYDALASTATGDAAAFFERMGKEEEEHAAAIRALLEHRTV